MSIDLVSKYFKENKSLFQISKMLNLPLTSVRELANNSKVIGHRLGEFCRANYGKKVLLFDLETIGLPTSRGFNRFYPYTENRHYDSARIVQLAYCTFTLGDSEESDLELFNFYRAPDKFQVSPESFRIHGLSQPFLEERGIHFDAIMDSGFTEALVNCDWIISHNIEFDFNILCNELHRAGRKIPAEWRQKLACTCRMTDFTRLGVLYEALVGQSNNLDFHNARSDVLALYRILKSY